MKGKKIFDAITGVKDDYIEEARIGRLKKVGFKWKTWAGLAACSIVVMALGGASLLKWKLPIGGSSGNTGGGGAGHDGSTVFMSYAGPVFPMKLGEEDKEILASRKINYDFSPTKENDLRVWGSTVGDSYSLENTSSSPKKVKLIYPFAASFSELDRLTPRISIDKRQVNTRLYAGGYSGGFFGAEGIDHKDGSYNLLDLDSWEGYKELLESGNYEKAAFMPPPDLNQKIIVYKFTDFQMPEGYDAATQAISFNINQDKTIILTYGFNGGEFREDGFRMFSYFVPNNTGRESHEKYIILIGDDIGDYDLQGYKTGACEKGNELEGVSATIVKEEKVLSSMMEEIIDVFLEEFGHGEFEDDRFEIPREIFLGSVSDFITKYSLISPSKTQRYDLGMLEDIIGDSKNIKRVFYLEFEAEIPANESISILAQMHKSPSYDFHCSSSENVGIQSYDMVSQLGSNLNLKNLAAEISSTEEIEIVNQNFGFDLQKGIRQVELDLDTEHYYLEIRSKE